MSITPRHRRRPRPRPLGGGGGLRRQRQDLAAGVAHAAPAAGGRRASELLAITFTRKAAQEMTDRLHAWLRVLALEDDATVREFLRERAVPETTSTRCCRARAGCWKRC
jgi:hypothetical protein